jgi:hypothetical protein
MQPAEILADKEKRDALVNRIQFGGDEVVKAKDGAGSATLSMAQGTSISIPVSARVPVGRGASQLVLITTGTPLNGFSTSQTFFETYVLMDSWCRIC